MMHDLSNKNIEQLIEKRRDCFTHRNAVRLTHLGETPLNLTVDYYNTHVLITDYHGYGQKTLTNLASQYAQILPTLNHTCESVTAKHRPDNLSRAEMETLYLHGRKPPDTFQIQEHRLGYEVSFINAGFGTGIFLDMADGRQYIRKLVKTHPRVLNLFSYTGAFSIAAGAGLGSHHAQRVIEVDTYPKWLKWSQDNQAINGLDMIRQRKEDAVQYMNKQKPNSFDLVICDPPSFARPKGGKVFRIEQGYKAMRSAFTTALSPGGILFACCNNDQTTPQQFERWLPRELKIIDRLSASPDFPNADYLKIIVLQKT